MHASRAESQRGGIVGLAATTALVVGFALSATTGARAEDDAAKVLKAMTDYVAGQKSISAAFDSDIEVITPELQKIQFASSGQFQLSRPDKVWVKRTGGYADVVLVYDGKTLSLLGKNSNSYAQSDLTGSVDKMIEELEAKSGLSMPGADLLLSKAYDELMAGVIDAKHIGQGVVDGVECEHLAFRNADTDWQIWVEAGPKPIPHKYVITSKTMTGAPQYTLRIKDWKTDAKEDADTFTFKPPAGATKVTVQTLRDFDEIPAGTPVGGKK